MEQLLFISLIYLIQHQDKFDGNTVRVVGLCSFEFERQAMWISKDDMENAVTKNAVWLDTKLNSNLLKNDGKYMIVEGIFNQKRKGHLGMYSGTIENISRLDLWHEGESADK